MSGIQATIKWQRNAAAFHDNLYSRLHTWEFDGGAEWPASSSPAIVPVPMSDASAVDPEEAFVASLSSCHMLWFLSIAARKGFVVDHYLDQAHGEMNKNADGKTVIDVVTLRPKISWSGETLPSEDEIMRMHEEAHDLCFIANSVRTTVKIQPQS